MRKRDALVKLVGLCLLAGVLLAGLLFPAAGAAGVLSNQASETVDRMSSDLVNVPPALVTNVQDSQGNPVTTLYDQYRLPAPSNQISAAMKWALVSVEDRRFYDHHGVDWKGTMRAALSNGGGGDTQGASTLTQQYVKNYLINVVYKDDKVGRQKAQEQSIARKLKEARIAIQLETKMSKDQILTGYLNVVEFAQQVYGVGAAAQSYFGTTSDKLDVPQSALLAGMVNNPGQLDPWKHPEHAKQRRNEVIDRMVENQKLARPDAERFKAQDLGVKPEGPQKPPSNCQGAGPEFGFYCQYTADYLRKIGISDDQLKSGGYTIKTALDRKASDEASKAATAQVAKGTRGIANTLSLVRPGRERHEVTALAANKDYGSDASKDQTTQALPSDVANGWGAGSTYKIFTTAAALAQRKVGIYNTIQTPPSYTSHVFYGSSPACGKAPPRGTFWYCLNNNESSHYPASMSLQEALATSPNTGFVILEEMAGLQSVLDMASKLGMRDTMASNAFGSEVDPTSSNPRRSMSQAQDFAPKPGFPGNGTFTLGASTTSGLELANVAATLMSGGKWCPPTPLLEVRDRDGKPIQLPEPPCEQAVDEKLANTLAVGMSKDDQPGGTSAGAAGAAGWNRPIAGKTGTTNNNLSATFVGATPQMAGAAMTFKYLPMKGEICDGAGPNSVSLCGAGNMFGGKAPARTFYQAMGPILAGQPALPLPPSDPMYERAG